MATSRRMARHPPVDSSEVVATGATTWHPGERIVHERVGESAIAARISIQATVPPVAAEFLAAQSLLWIASRVGRDVWVSPVSGPPGFASVSGLEQVVVSANVPAGDPLESALAASSRIGILAIEPGTRRRMRLNGRSSPTDRGFVVDLDQTYSNCSRFIQRREPGDPAPAVGEVPSPVQSTELSEEQTRWLESADTFFIGTTDASGNADASHRGGTPGFVKVMSPTHFRFPDYAGNHMYMTLGNLEVEPSAGFSFVDWQRGAVLQISGQARVEFDSAAAAAEFPGAKRVVDVTVASVLEWQHRLAGQWSPPEPSRSNPPARHDAGP